MFKRMVCPKTILLYITDVKPLSLCSLNTYSHSGTSNHFISMSRHCFLNIGNHNCGRLKKYISWAKIYKHKPYFQTRRTYNSPT